MWACGVGLAGLWFRVRDRDRVMVGARVRVGVKFNAFYFLSHLQPAEGVGMISKMERAGIVTLAARRRGRYDIQNGTGRDAGMFCDWTAGKTDKL